MAQEPKGAKGWLPDSYTALLSLELRGFTRAKDYDIINQVQTTVERPEAAGCRYGGAL